MFNLEKEINQWKKSLRKNRGLEDGYIEEMESFLLDKIDELKIKGLNNETAFNEAINSIGKIENISADYLKVDSNKLIGNPDRSNNHHSSSLLLNYLKIGLRQIRKHKIYSTVNLSGLAIGLACVILISLWVSDELSYDKFNSNYRNLYRVVKENNSVGSSVVEATTPPALSPYLSLNIPGIKKSARYFPIDRWLVKSGENQFTEKNIAVVDSSFLDMFSYEVVKGNSDTWFKEPFSIILTREASIKYFGDKNPVGEVLNVENRYEFIVTGVIDVPRNSHLQFDLLASMAYLQRTGFPLDNWWWSGYNTYIQLEEKTSVNELNSAISNILVDNNPNSTDKIFLQPLADVHLYSSDYTFDLVNSRAGDIKYVYIFALLSFFILLIACFNFINLTTARSINRIKEVGLRKVVGAGKTDLVRQFYGEVFIQCIVALGTALAIVATLLPWFNSLADKQIVLGDMLSPNILSLIFLVLSVTTIVSAGYPAVYISKFQPVKILRGDYQTGNSGVLLRRLLVTLQFVITIGLLSSTFVIYEQINYMKHKDTGYETEWVISFQTPRRFSTEQYENLKTEMLRNPGIKMVSKSMGQPFEVGSWMVNEVNWPGKKQELNISVAPAFVDFDYLELMEMSLVSGRSFSKDYSTDAAEAIIINETFAEYFESDPLGIEITFGRYSGTVIGVVKDFHHQSLHKKIEPLILKPGPGAIIFAKLNSVNLQSTISQIGDIWAVQVPGYSFDYSFVDEAFDKMYKGEERLANLISYFSFLGVFVSCIGLVGLISFITEKKTKEIGIRKVLGSTTWGITRMLLREFTLIVIIAAVISIPVVFYYLENWLADFAYRIDVRSLHFLTSIIVSLIFSISVVIFQAVKAAKANPVDSIRHK